MIQHCHDIPTVPCDMQPAERSGAPANAPNDLRKIPRRTAAVVALMQTGIRDHAEIASAVGLTIREVIRIDLSRDPHIRRLGVDGIPPGEFFHLRRSVRCPRCAAWITVAPCVTCQVRDDLRKGV